MNLFLKGGTVITVDLKKQVFSCDNNKISVFAKDVFPKDASVEVFVIPFSYLQRIEL